MRIRRDDYRNFQERVFDQLGEMEIVDEGERKQIVVLVLIKLGVDPVLLRYGTPEQISEEIIKCTKGRSLDDVEALIQGVIAERHKAR